MYYEPSLSVIKILRSKVDNIFSCSDRITGDFIKQINGKTIKTQIHRNASYGLLAEIHLVPNVYLETNSREITLIGTFCYNQSYTVSINNSDKGRQSYLFLSTAPLK